ncbi:hypothetical protein FQN50_003793 [Emmonsiellopsis sp. PD_5]|nr:hypothetical protein FQN50_003793 [Emmonsiellopsis sp. PD_5]
MADAPGFQLLAGLNSSLLNRNNDGSETSSFGSDIPAKPPPTPKRKRREAEMLRQPTRLNGGFAENLNEGRKLRRPESRRARAALSAFYRRGEHIYDLPSSPEVNRPRRSARIPTQRSKRSPPPAEMWSDENAESDRDGEGGGGVNVDGENKDIDAGGEQGGNRDATRVEEEEKKDKEDSDADYVEEKEGEDEDIDAGGEQRGNRDATREGKNNKGDEEDSDPDYVEEKEGDDEVIDDGGEQGANRDTTKEEEDKKEDEEDSDPDYVEEKEGEDDKDDNYEEKEGDYDDEDVYDNHIRRALRQNRRKPQREEVQIVPSLAGSASDDEMVEPEAGSDEPLNENWDKHEDENMDDEDRDGIPEEAREEADDSEKESQYSARTDSREDFAEYIEEEEDVFRAAATLYGQEDRWATLLSVTKTKHNQPKNAPVCHLLRKITRAKQLYDRTREIRHSGQNVASHLEDEEEANKSGIIRSVSDVLSETKIHLTRDGRVMSRRELMETVHDIIDHLIPQMVELLKFCLTAHYVDERCTINGMRQLVPFLKVLDEIFDNIRPASFKPHVYIHDRFRDERPAARELAKAYKHELQMWEGRIWRENYNKSIREKERKSWLEGTDDIHSDRQETVIPTTEGGWDGHRPGEHLFSSDNESFANHSPSPDPHVWTDEESKALIAGLKKHQGPGRYTLIIKEYDTLLRGRTWRDLETEARRIRDAYVATMAEQNRRLDTHRLGYLLDV